MIEMKRVTKKKIMLSLLSIFLVYSFSSFFYVLLSSAPDRISLNYFFYMTGRLFGLIGFLFLSLLIISGDTARFFDKFFGLDKIIKFQRKFSLVTAAIVLFHPVFFTISGVLPSYFVPAFVLPLAFGIISLVIFIFILIASKLYKRISYHAWRYIHILVYLLFFLSLYHAVNIGSDSGSILIQGVYGILFASIAMGIIYRTGCKIKQRKNKFYVKGVKWETKDTFTLMVKPRQPFSFKPGQFCFLRLNKNKLYARHPFTISSSPNEDTLNFTMKITGRFTKTASQLKKGEEITAEGPFGTFTVEENNKNLVFIAGGVGIAPFRSMLKRRIQEKEKQHITLLYGSRTERDIIFKKELENIKESWFKKAFVLSEEPSDKYETGFINKDIMKKHVEDTGNCLFYVCGPEPMKYKVVGMLKKIGVEKQNIKVESFFW